MWQDFALWWPGETGRSAIIDGRPCCLHHWLYIVFWKEDDMADIANKYSDNVPGKYFVDNQCIDCDLCRETAPANFTRNEDGGYSFVYKQPENEAEETQCQEAMAGCPVEAIGNTGDQT